MNVDLEGWRPPDGFLDKEGNLVEDRIYNRSDFDRLLVIEERRRLVAQKVTEFLKGTDAFSKTILFCVDIEHAEGMRQELVNANGERVRENPKYVMRITGDCKEGKEELDNFTNPSETYPVIAVTSKLMTTGIDAQTCKVIVLDSNIQSMTEFKQIIGRGTRICEEYGKTYFTIIDFRNVTDLFADPDFDGNPARIRNVPQDEDLSHIENDELAEEEPVFDEETGEVLCFPEDTNPNPDAVLPVSDSVPRHKIYVNNVDVTMLVTRELHFDEDGKPITISLKDHTRGKVLGQYASLDSFLSCWNRTEQKAAVITELKKLGVRVDELLDAVNRELDIFDIICHIVFEQPPLTRTERANNVKKKNYFAKYQAEARAVLEALLDKYAEHGVENLESMEVLKVQPFEKFGSPLEIIRFFGGKEKYLLAIRELENLIYQKAV